MYNLASSFISGRGAISRNYLRTDEQLIIKGSEIVAHYSYPSVNAFGIE